MSRSVKYALSLSVSAATVDSWQIKVGYKNHRHEHSTYTDGHERLDMAERRKAHTKEKRENA